MLRWRSPQVRKAALPVAGPDAAARPHEPEPPPRDTTETRRAARTDLLAGIGDATETNLPLGKILRDAFGLVDEIAAFSREFDRTAETTRARADQFVASVCHLQSRSDGIETRLTGAARALESAQGRSQSALASVEELTTSIDDVERVINMIADVATQTNLLALNATIEAARAGAAGAGFRVVAGEVKALSQQTRRATDEIFASVRRMRDRAGINMAEVKAFEETVSGIEAVFAEVRASVRAQGEYTRDIGLGSEELADMAQKVRSSAGRMQAMGGTVKTMTDLAETAATSARQAFATLTDRAEIVLRHGDNDEKGDENRWPVALGGRLIVDDRTYAIGVIDLSQHAIQVKAGPDLPPQILGDVVSVDVESLGRFDIRILTLTTSGYETVLVDPPRTVVARIAARIEALRVEYQPYIDRVRDVAAEVARSIEAGIDTGSVAVPDLFDADYRRDGDTEPAQYLNAAVAPLEAVTRALLEREFAAAPIPDFCMLQDRNGFNPIHNLVYSRPPRMNDIVWNLRHARARRIFDDRVGMAASRNLRPFIVQSYARDMGDAIETRMEFDAPLFVRGRHWGAVRMAYRLGGA